MKLRLEPILVGLACLGPLLLALLLYFGPIDESTLPVLENPERELLAGRAALPPVELRRGDGGTVPEPWASYRWSLIYVAPLPCGESCRSDLERLRQVHDALSTERHRVRRVFLYAGEGLPGVHDPALSLGALDSPRQALWEELFGGAVNGGAGRFFVADPLGNLVVAYPSGADRSAMLEDVERLLDVSRIG